MGSQESFVYGTLSEQRTNEMMVMRSGLKPNQIMSKVYGVFKLVGFESFSQLGPKDEATLAFIEKYVKLRQGEVWQDIKQDLDRAGIKPTAADRYFWEFLCSLYSRINPSQVERNCSTFLWLMAGCIESGIE